MKEVVLELPITVRSLAEAMGISSEDLLAKLINLGFPSTITIHTSVDISVVRVLVDDKQLVIK